MLNIFDNDAFSVFRLTQAINNIEYRPGRIEQMGLFETDRVDTTIVAVERQGDMLKIVAPTPRGGPGRTVEKGKRDLVPLIVPHFEINDAINADEVQGVRAFGTESALETVINRVAQRQRQHAQSMALTEEYARLGAVRGLVVYADDDDGNEAQAPLDLFQTFGITEPAAVEWDFTSAAEYGDLIQSCSTLTRSIGDSLGGIGYGHIHAFVGDEFFDNLLKSPEVRESYKNTSQAEWLRAQRVLHNPGGGTWGVFEFGGIVWENYRGLTGTDFGIPDQEAAFFPVGVPGLFRTVYAPADYVETVNTLGQRLYNKQWPSTNGKRIEFEVQMNALQYCSRPGALRRGEFD